MTLCYIRVFNVSVPLGPKITIKIVCFLLLTAMFRKIFMDWAVKQGEMLEVPKGYDFEGIRSKIKSRMKTFMESRRERLLARIGLVTIARQREYSYRAGGQFEEA